MNMLFRDKDPCTIFLEDKAFIPLAISFIKYLNAIPSFFRIFLIILLWDSFYHER